MWRHRWGILSDNNEVGTINVLLYISVSSTVRQDSLAEPLQVGKNNA